MPRRVLCPQCRSECDWEGNPHRPFCSERCRLIDLGAWLDERYVIPGDPAQDSSDISSDTSSDASRDTPIRPSSANQRNEGHDAATRAAGTLDGDGDRARESDRQRAGKR